MKDCIVIFGGSGFIGCFFAEFVLRSGHCAKVYLYDLNSYSDKPFPYRAKLLDEYGDAVECVRGDVRSVIEWVPRERVALIANFAAVHREPGHEDAEYFETNVVGAENVTHWASRIGCSSILFTSSISPYGIGEEVKDETTLPVPVTPYGASKLVAEKIHLAWHAASPNARHLVIVRPGVVFGPGEGGNVTRLIKAVKGGYFAYMANRETRKAGIYVKELCNALWWVYRLRVESGGGVTLFNASMNPGPSIEDYVEAVSSVAECRSRSPNFPYFLLLGVAFVLDVLARPLGVSHPFSPVRIRKLVRSNNVLPAYLVSKGYTFKYTLETAMLDWKECCPQEWGEK
ncbi:NAD-dependent epimerase/dehydratase family protein [Stenotrophomonas maltophilia]|uniref:NAD-dependent epimerase/dehydratase family protein n=1 Tax=Stenotrophomonas maltophilia TaxID=40324 RepID=UPI0015DE8141|nr:NAD(P)-dependent oxidoreductase [Stenotrophomonas maltophilia]ELN2593348.1 NAD(P)-dependent oxidoreductase [Stenotrophomonas maltophilia]MBH1399928.1 NAD(P)-dependent oxidoreductase [Stenotrophomonas maltophilia]MBH1702288.1 NAD(P)-dependent oxidoreductase [Stenotrophomonas maltophilia]HDS1836466.1 NAD(P)-dependent oxidoreductase [Stenotrophomonas maltophilia]